MRIQNNPMAINAYNNLQSTTASQGKSLERLSSGFRINRASDDAAGLVISENLRSQVGGFKVAKRNAQDAISLVQTAEGALTEVHSMLQRMRDLSVQSANDTNDEKGRQAIKAEIDELGVQIQNIVKGTEFNGQKLFTDQAGGAAKNDALNFQVGAKNGATDQLVIDGSKMSLWDSVHEKVKTTELTVDNHTNARATIGKIDTIISSVSAVRGTLGATQNRLDHTVNNIKVSIENLTASESRIRDTDMAEEMMSLTRAQILNQAGTAMLSQANQVPQGVLSLLR